MSYVLLADSYGEQTDAAARISSRGGVVCLRLLAKSSQ